MKIDVCRLIPKEDRKRILQAVKNSHLCAPMKAHKVKIKMVKKCDRDKYAGLATMDDGIATIYVNHTLENLEFILYHECFHIHQISIGDLVQLANGFIWKKIKIPLWIYYRFYKFMPFEKAADKFATRMVRI